MRRKASCFGRQGEVQLGESGIALHGGGIVAAHAVQLLRRRHHQRLVGIVVVDGLRNDRGGAVGELHHRGHGQQVLIKAGIEKDAVFADRSSQRSAKLLLAIVGLAGGEGRLGIEIAIAQVVEVAAVPLIGARFGSDVEHRAARASQLRAVGVGRDAKLLDHLVAELIRRAIASVGLRIERIVVVGAVHLEVVGKSSHSAERQISVGIRGQTPRILDNSRRE